MKNKILISTAILLILIGAVGMAAYKFKFQEDFIDHKQAWDLKADEIKKLSIKSTFDINISFTPGSNKEGYIQFHGKVHPEIVDRLKNLDIKGPDLTLDLTVPSRHEFFSFNFEFPKGAIEVALPQGTELEYLDVSAYSGDINLFGVSSNNINISSMSGDVTANHLTANNLNLETYSGDIEGEDLTGNLQILSRSGDVELKQVKGEGNIENYSGDITITQEGVSSITTLARSGDIDITADPGFNGFYEANSRSGSVSIPPSPKESKHTIKAEAYSGNIDIRLP
ncbi:DUF4097 family beta strand repeat-containing protein [Paenibacillus dakarensis]|uniref:DUF4097 family beta strand repeat-containing protein n=1 Tax=Paenibacillus dakarensis TaxID=1527293 RepID=UPI0006D53828|nr:DUF4097 family beta strand repeat-containing protein [Paenibacillus dakarensis]